MLSTSAGGRGEEDEGGGVEKKGENAARNGAFYNL